ncbi:MAG: ROK family protein [Clostridia bacterium]|nr:ROK family protein [Clostridia bacterium]
MKIGVDIGGTKCAVILGDESGIYNKIKLETKSCRETLDEIVRAIKEIGAGDAIGISCGGPLDSEKGLILSPPNLPDWNRVPITKILSEKFGVPAYLCNDANACALAEWKYGAGRGTKNMIFLTFGTGLGAGLILDGRLFEGTNGNAGEVGHIRLCEHGPVGYGKKGSFEGFCSGNGLAQLGRMLALEQLQSGKTLPYCQSAAALDGINAKILAEYATRGEPIATEAYRICGEMLGKGLAVLVDLLNPEAIVIGSVFQRAEHLLRAPMEEVLEREALSFSREVCRVLPAELGDSIGDYAALAVAFGR